MFGCAPEFLDVNVFLEETGKTKCEAESYGYFG